MKSPLVNLLACKLTFPGPNRQVIRALYDYEAQSTQELSFSRGDFFHVIGRENDPDWYEACNPALPDARGLVPVAFFQALGKTERDSQQSDGGRAPTSNKSADHDSGYGEASSVQSATAAQSQARTSQRTSKSVGAKAGTKVYGRVLYDFAAERADELEAKKGESIIVIAQSNPEWFVAKPISRLGGPGLIPVSFVELLNMDTGQPLANPEQAIEEAGIPKVEEWKKMAAEYKNSSITLGKFEGGSGSADQMEQGMQRMSLQQGRRQTSQSGQQVSRLLALTGVNDSITDLIIVYGSRLIVPRHVTAAALPAAAGLIFTTNPQQPKTSFPGEGRHS